jgi:hypothetical protein
VETVVRVARVATIVVPAADLVVAKAGARVAPDTKEDTKDGMKAGRVAAAEDVLLKASPKSNWRS